MLEHEHEWKKGDTVWARLTWRDDWLPATVRRPGGEKNYADLRPRDPALNGKDKPKGASNA